MKKVPFFELLTKTSFGLSKHRERSFYGRIKEAFEKLVPFLCFSKSQGSTSAKTPQEQFLHASISVRPKEVFSPAWSWALSDGRTGLKSAHAESCPESASVASLEMTALLDILKNTDQKVVYHTLTSSLVKALQHELATKKLSKDPLEKLLLEELRTFKDRIYFIEPYQECSCDKKVLRAAARKRLREIKHFSAPEHSRSGKYRKVATDGSYNNNARIGGWSWYISPQSFSAGSMKATGSGEMELHALIEAVKQTTGPLEIVSDCKGLVSSFNFLVAGRPLFTGVSYYKKWLELEKLVKGRELVAVWVPAHKGHPLNTKADIMARFAMREKVKELWKEAELLHENVLTGEAPKGTLDKADLLTPDPAGFSLEETCL